MSYKQSRRTFDDLIRESGWTEKDGPYPGVWDKRPAGTRCLWSVIWYAEDGRIDPEAIAPKEWAAVEYELADLEARNQHETAKLLQAGKRKEAREKYPEFAWPYSGRWSGLQGLPTRHGWPLPAWAMPPPAEVKPDPDPDPQPVTYPNGAEYEPVGACERCGETVYRCTTHPVRDPEMDRTFAAVYVPGGMGNLTASLYCQRHDPNAHLKARVGKPDNEPLSGDAWQPLGVL